METRIRELRKQRGLTLQGLAEKIGTTPQTVQRLETANMTVSTDWLQKFADVFSVHPADLLKSNSSKTIPLLGAIGIDGSLRTNSFQGITDFHLDIPAERPVAIRLVQDIGPYPGGSILIGNRLEGSDLANAHNKDCIVALRDGPTLLRRVISGGAGRFTLISYNMADDIRYDQEADWMARVVMIIRYL